MKADDGHGPREGDAAIEQSQEATDFGEHRHDGQWWVEPSVAHECGPER